MLMTKLKMVAVVSFICVFVIGLGAGFVLAAQAQQENPAKWEYKVVTFQFNNDTDATKQMNELAAERWEYIGLKFSGSPRVRGLFLDAVAFKRLKK